MVKRCWVALWIGVCLVCPHPCTPSRYVTQDPEGHDRMARAEASQEWTWFDLSLALLVVAAPLLLLHLLVSAAAFSPGLGPMVQVGCVIFSLTRSF